MPVKACRRNSKRHGFIATLLRIPHIVVAVNKMDLVDYDEAVYQRIVDEYGSFIAKLNPQDVTSIPVSALAGDNVVDQERARCPGIMARRCYTIWSTSTSAPARTTWIFDIRCSMCLRPNQNFRGYAGQLASGRISPGEEVVVFPSGFESRVKEIVTLNGAVDEAKVGRIGYPHAGRRDRYQPRRHDRAQGQSAAKKQRHRRDGLLDERGPARPRQDLSAAAHDAFTAGAGIQAQLSHRRRYDAPRRSRDAGVERDRPHTAHHDPAAVLRPLRRSTA